MNCIDILAKIFLYALAVTFLLVGICSGLMAIVGLLLGEGACILYAIACFVVLLLSRCFFDLASQY